jgi:hypothetical protein
LLTQPDCIRWCSGTFKALRVVAEEAISLDSSCARRLRVGDEETGFHIEQRTDEGRKMRRSAETS